LACVASFDILEYNNSAEMDALRSMFDAQEQLTALYREKEELERRIDDLNKVLLESVDKLVDKQTEISTNGFNQEREFLMPNSGYGYCCVCKTLYKHRGAQVDPLIPSQLCFRPECNSSNYFLGKRSV
jgi:hypothetical protein